MSTEGYRAAHEGAAVIDRSDRVRVEFSGAKTVDTLNGLFTNDVTRLTPGSGQYAAALTAKGKVIADVRIFPLADRYIVDLAASAGPGFLAMLRKFVNPRLCAYRDISDELGTIGVFGPAAATVLGAAGGVDPAAVQALGMYGHITHTGGFWARVPDLGVEGFDVFVPRAAHARILAELHRGGAIGLDAKDAEVLRVEAGRALWGPDMDESTLAQEAALDRADLAAISFDKGCYTGQETVARVHFRGHVNRTLRGLRASAPLEPGMTLHASDGAQVGEVRSAVVSPRFGAIALAYVRHEIADNSPVSVRSQGLDVTAMVVALPFR